MSKALSVAEAVRVVREVATKPFHGASVEEWGDDVLRAALVLASAVEQKDGEQQPLAWLVVDDDGRTYGIRLQKDDAEALRYSAMELGHGSLVPLYASSVPSTDQQQDSERYRFLRDNPLQLRMAP